jgi:CRP-like cAMP-binding protein
MIEQTTVGRSRVCHLGHLGSARSHDGGNNLIIAALAEADYERLRPHLELIYLAAGSTLYEPNERLSHAYFPTTCVISVMAVMEDGTSAQLALTGYEGLIGTSLLMGGGTKSNRGSVQCAGYAYRLPASILRRQLPLVGNLGHWGLRFTHALVTQMGQTAACNRHHTIDQQFCRWLLMTLDRVAGNEIKMTQELIANMLGVQRERVTEVATQLHSDGLIQCRSATITVIGRPRLERRACECYAVFKKSMTRYFAIYCPNHEAANTEYGGLREKPDEATWERRGRLPEHPL